MNPTDWLNKALKELGELEPNLAAKTAASAPDPGDAWRAVTLVARLLGSPTGPTPPSSLLLRLPELIHAACTPHPQEVLDAVAEELDSEADPWGTLMDALLDADDVVGVLVLAGQAGAATQLSEQVAGLVSLYPERTLDLASFAMMRLETVRVDSAVAAVWRSVERGPAQVLADSLAPVRTRTSRVSLSPKVAPISLPDQLWQAAAESPDTASVVELDTEQTGIRAWVYREEGKMMLEAKGLASSSVTVTLLAKRSVDGGEVARRSKSAIVSGDTVYLDLGPWSGGTNLLQELLAGSGAPRDALQLWLIITNE